MSFSNKTTFNVGDLIPLCRPIEVLPGDTFSVDTSKVVRLQTLLKPVMDNLYLDTYWFFVPNRLVWSHWKDFMGENTQSAWLPTTTYRVPTLRSGTNGWPIGSIADYFGVPTGVANMAPINALPFRAYALICNDWFRSENLTDPVNVYTGDGDITYTGSELAPDQPGVGSHPFKACKFFDYFTAALPAPQKGPDVLIPMEAVGNNQGWIPVRSYPAEHLAPTDYSNDNALRGYRKSSSDSDPVHMGVRIGAASALVGNAFTDPEQLPFSDSGFVPSNLWALGNNFRCDINSLRLAFQVQKLYEKDARGGTRYIEIIKSHFGVTSPDSRMQRPEYLGGNRIPLTVHEVTNNSYASSSATEKLGDVAAMSRTTDVHSDFTHSFTEHGFLICLGVARYDHSYQQGIHKSWLRRDRLDYYFPVMANIGETPVLKREIYATANDTPSVPPAAGEIFGYQEAWADYRYCPNMITGMFRSASNSGMDVWHFGDVYNTSPTLSDSWIREAYQNVDRALAVSSSVADQLFGDFYFKIKATRCMPVYSIPGLIDHH